MELLPKWELTGTLPAFSDDDSSTVIEMTYKLYNTMQTLISEYNSFADSVNSKILAFESKYNSDFESFTTSIRQEIQEFTNTFNSNIANLNSRLSEVDSKYQTSITNLQNQINTINNILASDDVNLDTLQELVNALKNNVSSINDLFTELAKKVNITDYNAKITTIEGQITSINTNVSTLSENTYRKNEIDTKVNTINSNINTLSNSTYKKTEIDTKVNTINSNITSLSNNTYTKAEVDDLVANSGGSGSGGPSSVRIIGNTANSYANYGGLQSLIQKYRACIVEVKFMGRTASFTLTFNKGEITEYQEKISSTIDLLLVFNITKAYDYQLSFYVYQGGSVIVIDELLFDITNGTEIGMSEAQNVTGYYETPTITQVVFF